MKNASALFFDVDRIYSNYQRVQADFDRINRTASCARDAFDSTLVNNLMLALNYLNAHLRSEKKERLLEPEELLELNAIVHLGLSREMRSAYKGFLRQTEDKFYKYFPTFKALYKNNNIEKDGPHTEKKQSHKETHYEIAASLYVRILAAPQLFFDGNHRTGALVANHYLLTKGLNPFVLTTENAVDFFDLASDIKFKKKILRKEKDIKKKDIKSMFKSLVGWPDEVGSMRDFLMENAQPFTTRTLAEWKNTSSEEPTRYVVTDSVRKLSCQGPV